MWEGIILTCQTGRHRHCGKNDSVSRRICKEKARGFIHLYIILWISEVRRSGFAIHTHKKTAVYSMTFESLGLNEDRWIIQGGPLLGFHFPVIG